MAYKLQIRRGLLSALPIGISGEPLFATDTNDLYISNGTTNQKFQKFIASGTSSQFLKGDGSLDSTTYQPLLTNPVTGTGTTNYLPKWTSGSAIGNSVIQESSSSIGIGVTPIAKFQVKDNISGFIFQEFTNGAAIFLDGANGDFIGGNYFHIIANGSSYLGLGGYGGAATPVNISSSGNLMVNATTDLGERVQVQGNVLATSFIKSGGTSSQILGADGSVITAGTNITISGGTISSSGGGGGSIDELQVALLSQVYG